jgi:serine/threonine protein kinase/ribosomal protein L40E
VTSHIVRQSGEHCLDFTNLSVLGCLVVAEGRGAVSTCPQCNTSNRTGARFCRNCRSVLSYATQPVCRRCGAVLRPTARFCRNCGSALSGDTVSGARRACPWCGALVRPNARFCAKCYMPLAAAAELTAGARCLHCGTLMRPGARFCRICSHPLGHQPVPSPPSCPPSVQPGRFGTGELIPLTRLADGRYIVLEKIAQGGMGAIYRAQDRRLHDKIVAVKEMSGSAVAPDERKRVLDCFKREAELLARLEHPNLVRVSDLFQEADRHYMVMEFVEGRTLEKMLKGRIKPFPEDRVLAWAAQLCEVLSYLHGQEPPIIYRDVKPANVMVVDGGDTVKLIDFGIARFFKPGKRRDTIELGTDGYAPPEQYGKSQTDERADVYALGAMLHQLLTLRDPAAVPFQFPSVRSLNPGVSPRVDAAIAKAVATNKANRHSSAAEMLIALLGDEAEARRSPAKGAVSPAPGRSVVTPSSLDFGPVKVSGVAPAMAMKVDLPAAESATLSADVPWLHVSPRDLDRSGDVTVTVYPRRLVLGEWSPKGLGWLVWPARFLVPEARDLRGCVEITLKGSTVSIPVRIVAVPARGRVVAGWAGTIALTLGMLAVASGILLLAFGALGVVASW